METLLVLGLSLGKPPPVAPPDVHHQSTTTGITPAARWQAIPNSDRDQQHPGKLRWLASLDPEETWNHSLPEQLGPVGPVEDGD